MSVRPTNVSQPSQGLRSDFHKFWLGQTISNLGNSFSIFLFPLLIFKLTGSALSLALMSATAYLPFACFGLVIGAWVDRVDRKKLMIVTDSLQALIILSIPLLDKLGILPVWWLYFVAFISSTLAIAFDGAQFAAIPCLVELDDLVTANGRIQASYAAATVVGPILAGVLLNVFASSSLFLVDACSFLVSVGSLAMIRTSFNQGSTEEQASETGPQQTSIIETIAEGLRYVWQHPVLRAISLMVAMVNFVSSTLMAQLVLFAKQQFQASDTQVALLFAAGSVGIVVLSLFAGRLQKRWSFSTVVLWSLLLSGVLVFVLALVRVYWLGIIFWGLIMGLNILFNVYTGSLRQAIVPNHMLGRVMTIASVLAWSAIPLGTLLGGLLITQVKNTAPVYAAIGILIALIACLFFFTALGHAERYLNANGVQPAAEQTA